ncbi:hypothetical protein [Subtercola boreus]|uniref:RadC-like JAB domain-containing protein n=1 Tax=Subtercola boreus TaxID=120213 RepID=A0A3E0WF39_9MICO|nr:hypothetical protein [Subtercola boreus]RFA23395.1 hypothetical protein B7R24_00395 [Subtercola boreus]RFA23788.1 hypothetical protein B7R23_00395 [Subtercola boreus]RFA29489.1 hypothetical protein B7R25_00390 [Subtercola boreus]
MNTRTAEKALHDPLTTDTQIEDRALRVIGTAARRQLWLMMLDDLHNHVPIVIPLDDLPPVPDRTETDVLVSRLAGILDIADASQLILVWERPGRGRLAEPDTVWARALAENCLRRGVRLRAQLLSHTRGVTLLSPADYGAVTPTAASSAVETGC